MKSPLFSKSIQFSFVLLLALLIPFKSSVNAPNLPLFFHEVLLMNSCLVCAL